MEKLEVLSYALGLLLVALFSTGLTRDALPSNGESEPAEEQQLTFGVSVAKVLKIGPLPVRFPIQPQYMPVHPDAFGQKWNIQVTIAPVIPKLIKGNVFEN